VSRPSEASITVYRAGPLLVRGPVRLIDEDGDELLLRRATVALCRCGRSKIRPLCDGTHADGRPGSARACGSDEPSRAGEARASAWPHDG
jgi:CDGSH-type Zn-finger protein